METYDTIPLPAFLPEGTLETASVPASAGYQTSDTGMNGAASSAASSVLPATAEAAGRATEDTAASATAEDAHFTARLQEHQEQQRAQWHAQVEQWRQEVERDPQLGGAQLSASVARAQLALDRFDTDKSIGRLLEQSGYGNHPAILRFFNRMADALMEDSPALGQSAGRMPPLEERMYAGWRANN